MYTRSLLAMLFLVLATFACSENTENLVSAPDEEENNGGGEVEAVSYATDVQPIFNSRCTNCHGSTGGVGLTSFNALMSSNGTNYGNNLVVPGNADASGLVDKIEPNPQHGIRMPVGGTLTSAEIQTIRTWIDEGAINN